MHLNLNRVVLLVCLLSGAVVSQNNDEFRALWVIIWEHISQYRTVAENKERVHQILDNAKKANMNAILWQARRSGTAYYNSSFEPWGSYTGNSDPGYDPLEFAVQQAHARGMELHAWNSKL